MSEPKFTKRHLDALPATGKQYWVKDDKQQGLCLLVSQNGGKAFYLRRKIAGRDERIRLGRFPDELTVEQARAKAMGLTAMIASGANPAEARRSLKAEPTFEEVFDDYLKKRRNKAGHPLAKRTEEAYRSITKTHLGDIMPRKLSSLTPERVRQAHARIASPARANLAKAVVSAVFRWAHEEGITDAAPPTARLKTKAVPSRERFLKPSEAKRFLKAVDASPQRDFFLLALLTGARRDNLLSMRWRDIDLAEAVWRVPKTKNGEPQTIPLTDEAVEVLKGRKALRVVHAEWVFPGTGGHMRMPRAAWADVLARAELDDHLRFHDLRRTLGSWQARQGSSLLIIGKSLGHRSTAATAIYSRLDLDPVRSSIESATTAMLEQARKK